MPWYLSWRAKVVAKPNHMMVNLGSAPLLHIEYCEAGTPPTIVSFQQNVNAYTGTVDTYLRAGQPAADNSDSPTLVVDESERAACFTSF